MSYEIKLPELGENDTSGLVVGILVEVGDRIEVEDSLIEVEISKATIEIPSEVTGIVKEIFVQEDDEIETGSSIMMVEVDDSVEVNPSTVDQTIPNEEDEVEQILPSSSTTLPNQDIETELIIPAAPSVRRMAREHGFNLSMIEGTGQNGRITKQDVTSLVATSQSEVVPQSEPNTHTSGSNRQRMSGIRLAIAKSMSESWSQVPHVTNFDKANMTQLKAIRQKYGSTIAKGKLTVTALMIKISAVALQKFPQFNSSLDLDNKEIIYHKDINIGIAVDTEQGLLVPVIKKAQDKNLLQISEELGEISVKARDGHLTLADMQDGTFTISNLGGIGGTNFTPIVKLPEVAILGLSRSQIEPIWSADEESFKPVEMMPLALSYDHRAIDGADAARFLSWLVRTISDPFLILLEG